jgi:hypothetical protein
VLGFEAPCGFLAACWRSSHDSHGLPPWLLAKKPALRLQPPKTASTQPPRRRPSEGFPVTHTRPFSPKWFHPQLEEGFAGGGEGLNCFLLYVLGYAKFYNYIVFLVFSGSCLYFVIHRQLIYCGTKPF